MESVNGLNDGGVGRGSGHPDGHSTGDLAEVIIGADDFCATLPLECGTLPIKSLGEVADLIVAQTRLPYGQVLTPADAELVLQGQPARLRPDAAVVCHPTCHCRRGESGKD